MGQPLVWLITGCSSGFGEAFVTHIISRGDRVIATARDVSKIQHLERLGAATLQLDVTEPQPVLDNKVKQAIAINGRLDVLVNNAGYILTGTMEDVGHDDWVAQFETNVFGVIKLTKAVLPHFRKRKSGTNVLIGSRSGWYGDAFCGPYSGSKFALEGVAESLRWETEPLGIRTLLVEPGRFRTNFLTAGRNLKTVESEIPEYKENTRAFIGYLAVEDHNQPGDVEKLVQVVVDMVRREGCAKDKEIPFRLPLGTDCYETIKEKCEETLRLLDEWKDVITGTDAAET